MINISFEVLKESYFVFKDSVIPLAKVFVDFYNEINSLKWLPFYNEIEPFLLIKDIIFCCGILVFIIKKYNEYN